ncbi:MAG: DUF362 domain-containing protein [Candidatus Absconditabacterales bacterium]|jgi:hypothetical protein
MSKVYFSKNIATILKQVDLSKLGNKVGIKVHFGEKGCTTFLNPKIVKAVYDKVTASGREAALIECNVLYKGSRTDATSHLQTAREHGFDLPIDILDGEHGEEYLNLNGCKIGKGIEKYDSLIILSHVKGHQSAGYGGAIKNIAMGLGSRAGKLDMHSNLRPSISSHCIGCGICAKNCNAQAISFKDNKAIIDKEKCEGCAMCIAVCPNNAVKIPWGGRTNEDLQKRMAEYTKEILEFRPKSIFINVLENITSYCDCLGEEQTPMMANIGILYSDNILPIEKASLDLLAKHSDGDFLKINDIDKYRQIELAQEQGLGESDYELIEI